MEKIIAVVVSYNRHAQLVACVEAIRNQSRKPDTILIVNNGSSDYTTVWLDQQEDIEQIYQENSGSAGGYHAGISWAYQHNFDWIWCMGDDGYPKNNALEVLLSHTNGEIGLLNSVAININDQKSFVWPTKKYSSLEDVHEEEITGTAHLFNGSLIHRSIVSTVGLPNKHLFYKGVGTEYFYRITQKHSFSAKTILQSIYYHPSYEVNYQKDWCFKNEIGAYFYMRNRFKVLQSKNHNSLIALFNYLLFLVSFSTRLFIKGQSEKRKKIGLVIIAGFHAITGNYSFTPKKVESFIKNNYRQSVLVRTLSSVKRNTLNSLVPHYTEITSSTIA